MEVIFIKDLKGQGKKGDIKKVKPGYARNFLIKNGYAVIASKENKQELDRKNKSKEKEEENKKQVALKLKEKLEKETLEFQVKVGAADKVFGSISAKQIKEALEKLGYDIDKKQLQIDTPVAALGTTEVKLNLYPNVVAKLKVHLVK